MAAFDTSRIRVRVERCAQAIDAGNRHRAIGGHVLPAIGERDGDVGGAIAVAHEGAGLEQVGPSGAAIDDGKIGTAAGQRKAGERMCREPVIGPGGGPKQAARRVVRSECSVAL